MRNLIIATLLILAFSDLAYARPKNLTLVSFKTSTETLDLGNNGLDTGDLTINMGKVYLKSSIEKANYDTTLVESIGTYVNRHITVNVDEVGETDIRDVLIQYTLPRGTISMTQIMTYSSTTHLPMTVGARAIIGGTGIYAGAKGYQSFTPILGKPPGWYLIKFFFN